MTVSKSAITERRPSDLTPEAADRLRRLVPDDPVPLPRDGSVLPCDQCGAPAPLARNAEPTVVTALAKAGDPPIPPGSPRQPTGLDAEFTRCPDCLARSDLARQIIARFPSLPARFGPHGATIKVESVLMALTVLGRDLPDPATVQPHILGSLVARLGAVGAECAWAGAFAPVQTKPPGTCAPRPWAGVSYTTRLRLQQAYAGHLADRVAAGQPEQRITPPSANGSNGDGTAMAGCVYCGVASVTRTAAQVQTLGGPAAARRELWRSLTVEGSVLGGRRWQGLTVSGYVCPSCADAIDSVGSIGLSSMERALSRWLRSVDRPRDAEKVERGDTGGLVGWGVWAASLRQRGHAVEANSEPWGHVKP